MLQVPNSISRIVFKVDEVIFNWEGFGLCFVHLTYSFHELINGNEVKSDDFDEYAEEHLAVCWHQYINQWEVANDLHHMNQSPQVVEST